MKKIVAFGGAFNPITKAHFDLGIKALEFIKADKLCFVPVGDKYYKPELEKSNHRVKMINILCNKFNEHNVEVDLTEVNAKRNYNTIDTLRALKDKYGGDSEIYFLMGADNLLHLVDWHNVEEILRDYKILTVKRFGYDIEEIVNSKKLLYKYKHNIIEVDIKEELMISSTMVRELICKNDKSIDNYIDLDVKRYIVENNLYR